MARQPDVAERLVVLKISTRLTAEPERLAKLQHTNIVPIYSVHKQEGLYGICMPYLGALTVGDLLLSRRNPLNKPLSLQQLISTVLDRRVSTIVHSRENIDPRQEQSAQRQAELGQCGESSTPAPAEPEPIESLLGFNELAESLGRCMNSMDDVTAALCIVEGVTEGMAFAHSRGIVHGDLKPENVLLANDGRPVILDFNLAGDLNSPGLQWVGGTLPYMSPEHLRAMSEGRSPERSDDVYSIGVILYRMVAGKIPFPDLGTAAIEEWIDSRRGPVPPPQSTAASISPSLRNIILKCLGPVQSRYPSAVELLQDIRCYRENRVLMFAPDYSPRERAGKFIRRHPVLTTTSFGVAMTTLVIAVAIIIGVVGYRRSERLAAEVAASELRHTKHDVLAALQAPDRNLDSLSSGIQAASKLLDTWRLDADAGLDRRSPLYQLHDHRREQVSGELASLVYALAGAESDRALLDKENAEAHRNTAAKWNNQIGSLAPQLRSAAAFQRRRMEGRAELYGNLSPGQHSDSESDSEDWFARMLQARENRNPADWLKAAERLVDREPNDPTTWFNLGSAYFVSGRFNEAAWSFDVSQRLQPGSLQSLFWRGLSRLQAQQPAAARADFSQCMTARPDWMAAAYNRALASKAMGDVDAALEDVSALCDKGLGGPRAWFLKSQLRAARGDGAGAAADQAHGLKIMPIEADDHAAVGVAKLASAPEEAIRHFQSALEIDPCHLASLQNSSYYYAELKHDPRQAIEFMSEIIRLRPDQASGFASRGILAARAGLISIAAADAEQLAKLKLSAMERLQLAGIYSILSTTADSEHSSDETRMTWKSRGLRSLKIALATDPRLADIAARDPDLSGIATETSFHDLIRSARTLGSP